LSRAIDEWRSQGFRLDVIYPADDPHTAIVSKDADVVRVTTQPQASPPSDRLPRFEAEFLV